MKKLIIIPVILFVFSICLSAQTFQAHVEGDTKIDGKLDVTDAALNTFIGRDAGTANTTGDGNTATGYQALSSNTGGNNNAAFGDQTLKANLNGNANTAVGALSMGSNNSGFQNTATGALSLRSNTSGQSNTASGYQALFFNGTGDGNLASGYRALYFNSGGNFNTAMGYDALYNNTGSSNTAVGATALNVNTSGSFNTAVGAQAGPAAGQTGLSNASAFGYQASNTASNQVKLGNASVTSICGVVDFTAVSDGRFKDNVREDVKGLDFVMNLRPVTYDLNTGNIQHFMDGKSLDATLGEGQRQTGFIAQEVDQLAKEMGIEFSGVDAPANEHSPYGLRYATFVVPLVKAVQEQQAIIDDLQTKLKQKDTQMTQLTEQYDVLESKVEQLVRLLDEKL